MKFVEWANEKTIIIIHFNKSALKIYAHNSVTPKTKNHREVKLQMGFKECVGIYQRTSMGTNRVTVPQDE